MRPDNQHRPTPTGPGQRPGQAAGGIVRAARLTAGLTLAQLGQRCGYSASQISRYERGLQPLTDITLLHRFATALAIPPQILGLAAVDSAPAWRHADPAKQASRGYAPNVSDEFQSEGGEDPVRRRELLARAAGLAGAAALGLPLGRPGTSRHPRSGVPRRPALWDVAAPSRFRSQHCAPPPPSPRLTSRPPAMTA